MKSVVLHDKTFNLLYTHEELCKAVEVCAAKITAEYKEKQPLFISVLNGAFMFTSELMKRIDIPKAEISFIKVSSYQDTESTGVVTSLIGLNHDISGRDIIIIEDMVDSGYSMHHLMQQLNNKGVNSIKVAAMFYKPNAIKYPINVDFFGTELKNDFVVGFGLDYNEYGRQLPDLYILDSNN